MKKYLMTGMAALAICAAFTSCSKDTDVYNSGVIENNDKQSIINNYNEAFVKTFGQPAANHQWGFVNYAKSSTRTTINVNGNEEKYENAPSLKNNEETEIRDYVRQLTTTPHVAPTGLKNYFVTQVHDGEETYTNGDGAGGILGSAHMNHLQIAMEEGGVINNDGSLSSTGNWMHINNFNHGDNTDWNGNTLVEDGGTFNFAYHGTEDSRYHDRWISVKGEDVDAYYNARGTYSGPKYAGFYYICFDFEGKYADGYTMIQGKWYNPDSPNGDKWENFSNIKLPGNWTNTDWSTCDLTYEWSYQVWDQEAGQNVNKKIILHFNDPNQVKDIQTSNFVGGNMVIEGNNKYDDWIVRLVEATPKNDPDDPDDPDEPEDPEYTLRVICEDLNAQAQAGDTEDSDWDFNDLVFDVAFLGSNQVQIKVVAVGGTMPIRINGEPALEAHGLFNEATNIMINTGAEAKYPNQAATHTTLPTFTRTIDGVDAAFGRNIKVEVEKNGQWIELEAKAGQPAAKMGVMPDFDPCTERQDITSRYSNFVAWVNTQSPSRWWAE